MLSSSKKRVKILIWAGAAVSCVVIALLIVNQFFMELALPIGELGYVLQPGLYLMLGDLLGLVACYRDIEGILM